jgi:membrane fusion protein, heavy metal efflux system
MIALALVLGCPGRADDGDGPGAAQVPAQPADLVEVASDSPMLKRIVVVAAELHPMPSAEVSTPAKLEIDPSRHARVMLPAPGRIGQVRVKVGDRVAAGDEVAALDSPDADTAIADFRQAEADIASAAAALQKADRDLDRARDLFEHSAVAKKEVNNAEAAHAEARAESARARAVRQQASRRLKLLGLNTNKDQQSIAIRAPMGGKVLELAVAPGEYRTDTAEPLMEIADLSVLLVAANVSENVIRLIDVGEPVEIELVAFPDEKFQAKVVRIADAVDPETRTIEVQAELPNPSGRFRPEMFGRVRHGHGVQELVAVPPQAIVHRNDRDVVLIEESPGRYRIRTVTTGARTQALVAVDGITAGERVVVDGAVLLMPQ